MNHWGPEQFIFSILADLYGWGKSAVQGWRKPGMYEVLDYESTLEIMDPQGRQGSATKVEKVRFLQDNVIAIQDQVWGFEKEIVDYQCAPGFAVDFYQSGHKTFVLVSLREVKSKKDEEVFLFQWDL